MTKDEQEIEEAKEDVENSGKDSQTEKDRIDESVGEQEKLSGGEDTQNAKDRVDESEGAEKADEKKEQGKPSFENQMLSFMERLGKTLTALEEKITAVAKTETKDEEAVKRMEETYGIGAGVFQGSDKSVPEKRITKEEVAKTINKIM